jgi:uncharacterized cupredoxin-like copper-binding protein
VIERQSGRVPKLKPGESRQFAIEFAETFKLALKLDTPGAEP